MADRSPDWVKLKTDSIRDGTGHGSNVMTFSNLTIAHKMAYLSCAEGEGEMIRPTLRNQRVTKSLDRKAVDNLFMQYRIERAARRIGRVSLFLLFLIASFVGIFRPKYLKELSRLVKLRWRRRSNAVSRPISVEGVGDKDAGAEYYKKPCYNFEHGAALGNGY